MTGNRLVDCDFAAVSGVFEDGSNATCDEIVEGKAVGKTNEVERRELAFIDDAAAAKD